jgi:AraC family transcriptional regulator of arabinose operon
MLDCHFSDIRRVVHELNGLSDEEQANFIFLAHEADASGFVDLRSSQCRKALASKSASTNRIDGVMHRIPPGHVALLKPNHLERFTFAKDGETWHRWIAAALEPLDRGAASQFEAYPLHIPISDRMNQLTDMMLTLQHQEDPVSNEELLASLGRSAILLYLAEQRRMGADKRKHVAVLIAKDYIHERYSEEIDLRALSMCTNMTPAHLICLFRRDEGMTPTRYLWQYRVKQGLDLLRSTGLNVGEVAERTGFKTSYHFARSVKRHTGVAPSQIRKTSWEPLRQ